MAYNEEIAERIRSALASRDGISERRMFGGIAFMTRGHMFAGVLGETLMARVGPDGYDAALARRNVREMDFTGKPMRGYVYVDPPGFRSAEALDFWIDACLGFVATLPAKAPKPPRVARSPGRQR